MDGEKFGRFHLRLLFWSFLAMVSNGFDISSLASAAPSLAVAWQVPTKSFGAAFTAGLLGVIVGSPVFGHVGDRFGRRAGVVAACLLFGSGTLACAWASSVEQMAALRFMTGIGIGGLLPNAIALQAERAPKRLCATFIVLMLSGVAAGSSLAGYCQSWGVPRYGWQSLFWVGGAAPLVLALCLWFALPPDDGVIGVETGKPATSSDLASLLRGDLKWLTPLLWCCLATALMANYFLLSWLPSLWVNLGFTAEQSSLAMSVYTVSGLVGGLLVSLVLARLGFAALAMLFALALAGIVLIALIGVSTLSHPAVIAVAGAVGFGIIGVQLVNSAMAGLLYPGRVRARGVGWALGVGRFVALLAPLTGALLVGRSLSLRTLFLIAAATMMMGLAASLGAAWVGRSSNPA